MSRIAYQGEPGAFSDQACHTFAQGAEALPCPTFDHVFDAVMTGKADEAMVPVENAIAGRVDDIYRILPDMELSIVSEHFLPVKMQLMVSPGADPRGLKYVRSHAMALSQCRREIAARGLLPDIARDTAGAARELAEAPDPAIAVIAPEAAAIRYGLDIVARDIQDQDHNVTRFLRLTHEDKAVWPDLLSGRVMTSMVFRVRNIPAALYKALGGFATNGVNLLKLESYQLDATFAATQFQAEFDGHPDDPPVQRALEELGFFSSHLKLLGVFPADPYRSAQTFNN
ncbi:prephenate dehydratase [Parvularcula sp. LCG005]|uniref:prephenate dehydratase n=1 Tax=Parvularcula sp. LCG005 TaxID=3078805 RepID=UPI002941E491|nr:prephenate dehydratase [Parvularcula sp. LCG005]WOI53164.1 prephenate dehydratase [Parvularcula sp. LCG005]